MTEDGSYNPLDKRNLGESVAEALLDRKLNDLPPEPFEGAGLYAIYYAGDLEIYRDIKLPKAHRRGTAIYVGKAIPSGARKAGLGLDADPGQALFKRLREHAKSIDEAENLRLQDFRCRYLVVDDIWIPLGESLLIQKFKPLWNLVIDGFGNHNPGKGRHGQECSVWDTLHPGREWTHKLNPGPIPVEEIHLRIREHFESQRR